MITTSDIEHYRSQGFVHLRGVLDQTWVELLRSAIARVLSEAELRPRIANMTVLKEMAEAGNLSVAKGPVLREGRSDYILAHNAWDWNDELRHVAFNSPLASYAARLMGSNSIRFYFDQTFIKPPGSMLRTQFHQDLGYWTCQGDQICTFWTAIDSVDRSNGAMGYVPGSHLWDEKYKANIFVARDPIPGQQGQLLPAIEADEDRFGVVYCDCEPGDVIVHHVKTVHGSTGNTTSDRFRRSVGLRYTGDDVTYHLPPGIPPESTPVADYLRDGDSLSGPLFPEIWAASESSAQG